MFKEQEPKLPSYRVPYQQCKVHFQKLNYICLNNQCHQKSLICSMCKDEATHAKHLIRPLKFYLHQLQEKYQKSQSEGNLNQMIDELEVSQYAFYQKLKKAVQDVAEEFRKLQEEVTEQISKIRNQIYEEIAKRNRFNEFYDSLKRGDIDHSNFLIQNYLPQASVGKIANLDKLQTLSMEVCLKIAETKSEIIVRQSTQSTVKQKKQSNLKTHLNLQECLRKPANIEFLGGVLTQNQIYASQSLCLIDFPVMSLSGKINFKILKLKKGSIIAFGAMPKPIYESMNMQFQKNKLDKNCFVIMHDGFTHGWTKQEISQFNQGSVLEISCRAGDLKLTQKNKSCSTKLPKDVELFVFVVLSGEAQVKMTHMM